LNSTGARLTRSLALISTLFHQLDSYLLALTTEQGATSNDDIVKVLVLLKEQILEQASIELRLLSSRTP